MAVLGWLQAALGRNTWPPPGVGDIWDDVELHEALRLSDTTRLRQEAGLGWRAPYVISPLPRLISRSSANLLYGEPPTIEPANEADQDALEALVSENGLDTELHRGAVISSSEGDVWGRILVQPALLDYPIIEFVSRRRVIPTFQGRFLVAATFVTEWATSSTERLRLLETYSAGLIEAELYRGTRTAIGSKVALNSFEGTAGTAERVFTGIPRPLVSYIPNSVDADPTRGFSDYRGLEGRFLALNEGVTIGQQNLKLAGRKRALVDAEYLAEGETPLEDDVYIRQARDRTMGDSPKPMSILEYSFEATSVVAWVDHLIDTTLVFAGYSPQSVGRAVEGGALSGTALKLKMAHSLIESAGKGRYSDRGIKWLLRAAAILDSRPTTQGGFGRRWTEPDANPSITRGDGTPRDDVEAAQVLVALTNAEAISTPEKVKMAHPDWSQDRVDEEVQAIESASSATAAPLPGTLPRPELVLGGGGGA